jgi:hypothetical protein
VKNILPEHFELRCGVSNLAVENVFDFGCRTTPRCCDHERADVVGQRKTRLISDREHVHNLGRKDCFRDTFRPLQADALGSNRFETSAIVQPVVCRIPENRIDVQQIVPQ